MTIVDQTPGGGAQVEAVRVQRGEAPQSPAAQSPAAQSPAAQAAGIRIEGLRKRYGSGDTVRALVAVMVICVLASVLAIRAALRVDPAEAIGG